MKFVVRSAISVFVLFLGSTLNFGQTTTVDPTFVPVPSVNFASTDDVLGNGILIQPDGKIVISMDNFVVDGKARPQIARLNTNGTIDESFVYCRCGLDGVSNVGVQPDGKLLVGGVFFNQAKMTRLNPDGSLDSSFNSAFTGNQALASTAEVISVQPDGKVLVNIFQSQSGGFHSRYVTRLNGDGSTDTGFTNIVYDGGRLIQGFMRAFILDPATGKYFGATTTFSGGQGTSDIRRYNSDGTPDNTWERPTFTPFNYLINGLALQPDGSLIISGKFDTVNGLSKVNLVRLAPAGNVDLNFTASSVSLEAGQVAIVSAGKILISNAGTSVGQLQRLNSDGSLDNTFAVSPNVNAIFNRWALDSSERLLFVGRSDQMVFRYFRLNPNGDVDSSFNPNVSLFGKVQTLTRQADGRVLIAGTFDAVNAIARSGTARLNADGTVDTSFNIGTGFSSPPTNFVTQPDGKIIATGQFSSFNGVERQGIVRLNSDGTLDAAFNPMIQAGQSVANAFVQTDGRILIVGNFGPVNGTARTGIARLNPDGTLDGFNPIFGSPGLKDVFQQSDGKIMAAGSFSGVNGFNRSSIVRLNDDGSLDQTFTANSLGSVTKLVRQPDGKYFFSVLNTVGRRNTDGSPDASFVPPSFNTVGSNGFSLESFLVQPDGTYIVVGRFDIVGNSARRNICRLTFNGSLDGLFAPTGSDAPIHAIVRQTDTQAIIGGEFTKIENVTRDAVARLSFAPFRQATPFDFDGDGRADIAVYRPSSGVWYQLFSNGGPYGSPTFGLAGDIPTPADFDGDGRTDVAIWRPSNGQWWWKASTSGQLSAATLGQVGDIPMPSDVNGDGTDEPVVYRPSNGTWYWATTTGFFSAQFGIPGDIPVSGDFDGDGKSDRAIFRPSNGDWWYLASSQFGSQRNVHWGATGDIPTPADFDGDGKTDFAVFRPSNGGWYVLRSSDSSWFAVSYGLDGDRPVAADYDGDGRADIAVFRPSTGIWYLLQSTAGSGGVTWGLATDVAIPNAFIH